MKKVFNHFHIIGLPEKRSLDTNDGLVLLNIFKSNGYEPIIFTKGNTNSVSKVKNSYTLIEKKFLILALFFLRFLKVIIVGEL